MPTVNITKHLQRFFPDLRETTLEGQTVADIVTGLNNKYPGIADYIVDERGALRKHVNIFIGNDLIKDRKTLGDAITPDDKVYIMQALSGG